MTRHEFIASFARIINCTAPVRPHDRLDSFDGWDSIAIVEFLAFMDRQFGSAPAIHDLGNCQTVADLINLAGNKLDDGSQPARRVA